MAAVSESVGTRVFSRLSWGSIIAGVLLALAVDVILGMIGAALGLGGGAAGSRGLGVLAGLWGLLTPLVSTLLGAWLACRLASVEDVAGSNIHGILVWSIGLLAGAMFLTSIVGGVMSAAGAATSGNAGAWQGLMGGGTEGRMEGRTEGSTGAVEGRAEGMTGGGQAAQQAGGGGQTAQQASGAAAKVAWGISVAGLAGLLGAFAGSAIARGGNRQRLGRELAERMPATGYGGHTSTSRVDFPERTYPGGVKEETTRETTRRVDRPEGPGPGYHH